MSRRRFTKPIRPKKRQATANRHNPPASVSATGWSVLLKGQPNSLQCPAAFSAPTAVLLRPLSERLGAPAANPHHFPEPFS